MWRTAFVPTCLVLLFISCQEDSTVNSFELARDTPQWLKAKIDTMSVENFYVGTTVYRHEWKGMFVYYIEVPLSSCVYCELYDHHGNKIQLHSDAGLQDYLQNRKNEIIVWKRGLSAKSTVQADSTTLPYRVEKLLGAD